MTDPDFSFLTSKYKEVCGWWVFPGGYVGFRNQFAAYSKPNWFHKKMMKLILGIQWEDRAIVRAAAELEKEQP
jgi:hypothetical protein